MAWLVDMRTNLPGHFMTETLYQIKFEMGNLDIFYKNTLSTIS